MGLFSKKTKKDEKKDSVKTNESKVKLAPKKDSKKEEKKDNKKVVEKKIVKKGDKQIKEAHRFLLKPIISEKATVGAADGKYTFEVSQDANKVAVKKAVEEIYGVEPVSVNIINQSGKSVRFGRHFGRTKNVKKAIVTLKQGDSIKLYEGI